MQLAARLLFTGGQAGSCNAYSDAVIGTVDAHIQHISAAVYTAVPCLCVLGQPENSAQAGAYHRWPSLCFHLASVQVTSIEPQCMLP
jgi:hypothetical protein